MNRALVLVLVLTGCASYMRPLAQLPLHAGAPVAPAQRPAHSILILPFDDQRGGEYVRLSPENFIPVASMVHDRDDAFYPEMAGQLRSFEHGRLVFATGSLGHALPSLLATQMGKMGLPDRVGLDASQPADYVVTGENVVWVVRRDRSFVLGLLAVLGVPFEFVAHRLEYDVVVYDVRDRTTPIFTRTYTPRGSRNVGLYYGQSANLGLFRRGLEETLAHVVTDVAAALATRG